MAWLLPRTASDRVTELLGAAAERWLARLACGTERVEEMGAGGPPPLLPGGVQRLIESMRWVRPGYPRLRMLSAGELLPPGAYMTGAGSSWVRNSSLHPNPAAIEALLADGVTLVLDEAEQHFPELGATCAAVNELTGCAAWANAYVNTNGASGFAEHLDDHDVLAVQCEGVRTWRLSAVQHQLIPGRAIAIPEGVPHLVEPSPAASLHVSIALRRPRLSEAMTDALGTRADDPLTSFTDIGRLRLRPRLKRTRWRAPASGAFVAAGWMGPLAIERVRNIYSVLDGPNTIPLLPPLVQVLATLGRRHDPNNILPPDQGLVVGGAVEELLSLGLVLSEPPNLAP